MVRQSVSLLFIIEIKSNVAFDRPIFSVQSCMFCEQIIEVAMLSEHMRDDECENARVRYNAEEIRVVEAHCGRLDFVLAACRRRLNAIDAGSLFGMTTSRHTRNQTGKT